MPVAWVVALAAAGAAGWRSATHRRFVANLSSVPRPFRVAFVTGAALSLIRRLWFALNLASVVLGPPA
jgi:hypothetical protein